MRVGRVSEDTGLIIDPLIYKYSAWLSGEINVFWFFGPGEELGGQMVARKRGTSTCRLIRSLDDSALCLARGSPEARPSLHPGLRPATYLCQ